MTPNELDEGDSVDIVLHGRVMRVNDRDVVVRVSGSGTTDDGLSARAIYWHGGSDIDFEVQQPRRQDPRRE